MAETVFIYEGKPISIQCNINKKMKEICTQYCSKIKLNINALAFLYGGEILNLDKPFNEITKENKIKVLVFNNDNGNEICPKCGKILNNKIIDDIIELNDNINDTLVGLYSQIDSIINDLKNKKEIKYINNQLKNVNVLLNKSIDDIKKINNELTIFKSNYNDNTFLKTNINDENIYANKENEIKLTKNEIICIYNKNEPEIFLLHDYSKIETLLPEYQKFYLGGKDNINGDNIDIYVNNKKIKFSYIYKSDELGKIEVKFKFKKLITKINHIFWGCSSLEKIDFSSFNSSQVENMSCIVYDCISLESINFSSFDTSKVYNMSCMFYGCKSLKSLDLSSFNTSNVKDMIYMFCGCSSLKLLNLSSFDTSKVTNMNYMFSKCSSLKSLDLSTFNTNNVKEIKSIFSGCKYLKENNIKINNSETKIFEQIQNL